MATEELSDILSCYKFVGRAQLRIDMATFAGLPLHELPVMSRLFLYAVLQLNRGKEEHALAFIRQAKERALTTKDLAYVVYVEGLLLLLLGEPDESIGCYKTCTEMCSQTGDKLLHFDALLLLSSIYSTLGDPDKAKIYERQAALMMPRTRSKLADSGN